MSRYSPDILVNGLDVVFCGINPAASAAHAGHNFSNASNRFWSVLHLSGFTDMRLDPINERQLLKYRCGITAVVERPTARAQEISMAEFQEARPRFEAKIRRYAPRVIAFLGKRAFLGMFAEQSVSWGRHSSPFAGSIAWILPNPSGLNRGFTLETLTRAYSELHKALETPKRVIG